MMIKINLIHTSTALMVINQTLILRKTNLEDRLIKIGETPIKQVSETKFLGIIIDDKLSWNPQIQYLKRKLSSSIGIMNRIKDYIPISLHKN